MKCASICEVAMQSVITLAHPLLYLGQHDNVPFQFDCAKIR
jgi:hypothetical protein